MAKRFLAAAIGVPMILAVVFFGVYAPILFDIAIAIICAVSVGEFSTATKTIRLYPLSISGILFAIAYPMLLSYGYGQLICFLYTGAALSVMVFCAFLISLRYHAI